MHTKNKNSGGQLSLLVATADSERVSEWVRTTLGKEPVEITKPYATESLLEIYFDSALEAEIARKILPDKLPVKHAAVREYQEQDWTAFWHHHFRTQEIGGFRIIPEWEFIPEAKEKKVSAAESAPNAKEKFPEKTAAIEIVINPGLSFGTGGHFTTRFCLQALEKCFQTLEIDSMIDAGTGSGILAIAGVKLGIRRVDAFDYDPVCIEKCTENAKLNGVTGQINFFQQDVLDASWTAEPADLVCANIFTSVLIEAAPLIVRAAKKRIILSGIREMEADCVAAAFMRFGCREISRDGDGKWCGLVLDSSATQ